MRFIAIFLMALLPNAMFASKEYDSLQRQLAKGWNTWDTRSVMTHVYLPEGMAIDLKVEDANGRKPSRYLIGDRGNDAPTLFPGMHTYDGSYSHLGLTWHGYDITVENVASGRDNVLIITPSSDNKKGGKLIISPQGLWRRSVNVKVADSTFTLAPQDNSFVMSCKVHGKFVRKNRNDIVFSLDEPIVICCGKDMNVEEAQKLAAEKSADFVKANRNKYGDNYDCYNAMQSVLAWDTFFDPSIRNVITPVSRIWSSEWFASREFGGFTLFCWDTYFASMMIGLDDKALAYANIMAITNAITESGFIPNCYYSNGFLSRDRSQPPVGSLAAWTLYERYHDKWLLEDLYPKLLSWNRWWDKNRKDQGLLCPGSSPYEKVTYFHNEYDANTRYGSILETGLDNSPMYDGVKFDNKKHLLCQNDVGLTSLYIMDCKYMAKIATELGKDTDAKEFLSRAKAYSQALSGLWDDSTGMFLNRNTIDGKFNHRMSPTNFYPLLAGVATKKQAERMVKEHLLNTKEFWGEWVIPSCPRNDPAYKDNDYWRGRIWAPLNFLVYMGLRNYDFPKVRKQFVEKSKKLLLKSWLSHGYVFENYNADTGVGDDSKRSDKFYHWGALLGYIDLIDSAPVSK